MITFSDAIFASCLHPTSIFEAHVFHRLFEIVVLLPCNVAFFLELFGNSVNHTNRRASGRVRTVGSGRRSSRKTSEGVRYIKKNVAGFSVSEITIHDGINILDIQK